MDRLKYWIWLSSLPGIGPVKICQLLKYFGGPVEIWNASRSDLKYSGLIGKNSEEMICKPLYKELAAKWPDKLKKMDIKAVTIEDENYPVLLKNIYDPPVVLYYKGTIVENEQMIAVVGSRKATGYGLKEAGSISYELSKYGITVVSGMARGIDSYAHTGALNGGGRTVAVLGCGVDVVYPPENKKLMDRIIESGAVVSEYLPGMQPLPGNFPARNRIISGLSMGVVVVEAGSSSGSLITAGFALEQGREVFALPGNICNGNSIGTNRLIRDGAKIVTEIGDILEELKCFNHDYNKKEKSENIKFSLLETLEGDERKLAECLSVEPQHIDTLSQRSGIDIQMVNSLLIIMELKGIIEQLPGKIFKIKE